MKEDALIIFIKNPELGRVKTRLAKSIGDEAALTIYKSLLLHTKEITERLNADKYIFYSDRIDDNDIWNKDVYLKDVQVGTDLGERMFYAFKKLFAKGYKRISIIGSDCYDLSTEILSEAFRKLIETDTVIGPAKDGGYYLLGLKKLLPELFMNKNWSTANVFMDTVKDLELNNMTYSKLELLSDIDELKDLEHYTSRL